MKSFLSLVFMLLLIACGHSNTSKFETPVPPSSPGPGGENGTGSTESINWDSVSIWRYSSATECGDIVFKVTSDRNWSAQKCQVDSGAGNLMPDEATKLNTLVTAAVASTLNDKFCPQFRKQDVDYLSVSGKVNSGSRFFDPDATCYSGSKASVAALRGYLQELRSRYTGF